MATPLFPNYVGISCLCDVDSEVNQNVPLTLFDKFHRNVNLLRFQKPMQLLVSTTHVYTCFILYSLLMAVSETLHFWKQYNLPHLACKNISGGMLAWSCVWVKVQICIWPN